MKTAGEVLKKSRLKQDLLLVEVLKQIKIPLKTLIAIEADNYQTLPPLTSSLGFIKNYAEFLGLDPAVPMALFRRGYTHYQDKKITPPSLLTKRFNFWTAKTSMLIAMGAILAVFALYIGWQLIGFWQAPLLEVDLPTENQLVNNDELLIKGTTDHDVSLTVNGDLISVDASGQFENSYHLTTGENNLFFVAQSRRGKTTTLVRHLNITAE
ncbi:helix-turn-helix domain-containing protein [Patescibacteria group bacterium]|nr:helix-turn-helix domain-containing protein [Patescibacteria group bacterium]MBU1931068.1 helix-turn-helix domain-containing protein [Patescibacteria group bacterium]